MNSQLTPDSVDHIIRRCMKQSFGALRGQIDGIKIEMKVIREEVKKMSWEIEGIKTRLNLIESA
jgi:hypothetical protein